MNIDYGDSRNALFVEPNAYIQNFNSKKETKKVVFQEPYECLPNYYINNNFKKGGCECVEPKKKHEDSCNCGANKNDKDNKLGFDLKNILPLFAGLNKGQNGFSNISQILSNKDGFNFGNIIQTFLKNPNSLNNVLNLFTGKSKLENNKQKIETTDYPIKNYTRVN